MRKHFDRNNEYLTLLFIKYDYFAISVYIITPQHKIFVREDLDNLCLGADLCLSENLRPKQLMMLDKNML